MTITDILKYISYKPKSVVDNGDGHTVAEFRRYKGCVPTLDLCCDRIIFEIANEGCSNSLPSVVADVGEWKNFIAAVREIVRSLHDLYSGEVRKSNTHG